MKRKAGQPTHQTKRQRTTWFLCPEIQCQIHQYLFIEDLLALDQVCRDWRVTPASFAWNSIVRRFCHPRVSPFLSLCARFSFQRLDLCGEADPGIWAILPTLPLRHLVMTVPEGITAQQLHFLTQPQARSSFTHLNVRCHSDLGDQALVYLRRHPLQRLQLDHAHGITAPGLARLPPLQSFRLGGGIRIRSLEFVAKWNLRELSLLGCINLTNDSLAALQHLPLRRLKLSGCTRLTNDGLAHLADLSLQYLGLTHNPHISDAGLGYLHKVPLRGLNVAWSSVRGEGIGRLMPTLQTLNVSRCPIQNAGLRVILRSSVQHLIMCHCRSISAEGVVASASLTHLDIRGAAIDLPVWRRLKTLGLQQLRYGGVLTSLQQRNDANGANPTRQPTCLQD